MGLDMEIRVNGEDVIYMRKVNSVRKWMADNLENFVDNGLTPVPKTKFVELLMTMKTVITEGGIESLYNDYVEQTESGDNADIPDFAKSIHDFVEGGGEAYKHFVLIAETVFPTSSGFFFGDTNYNEYYIMDVFSNYRKLEMLYNELVQNEDYDWDLEDDLVEYWEWY